MEEEVQHTIQVLEATKQALIENDSLKLKELSNQTIHSASIAQDTGSITIAVLVYALSKLLERREKMKIKNWDLIVRKFNSFISLSITSLMEKNVEKYVKYLEMARNSISIVSPGIKNYLQDILRRASINKASKIYEHGISIEQTAKLLGITQWELLEYSGQSNTVDINYNKTINVKKRIDMAMEFIS